MELHGEGRQELQGRYIRIELPGEGMQETQGRQIRNNPNRENRLLELQGEETCTERVRRKYKRKIVVT